ncbi:hypothetical protein OHB06_06190 [Streptomyces sp. NBC_01604]|uniref:hypothetical protein n=1 Tax=unclassified Streptomyces TaxID=2593676 RepID=UPI003865E88D
MVDQKEMTEELGKGKLFGALVAPRLHLHRRRTHSPEAARNAVRPTLTVPCSCC